MTLWDEKQNAESCAKCWTFKGPLLFTRSGLAGWFRWTQILYITQKVVLDECICACSIRRHSQIFNLFLVSKNGSNKRS